MSWSVACVERNDENLRDPIGSWWVVVDMRLGGHTWDSPGHGCMPKSAAIHTGKPTQLKEGWLKSDGESDSPIVL